MPDKEIIKQAWSIPCQFFYKVTDLADQYRESRPELASTLDSIANSKYHTDEASWDR